MKQIVTAMFFLLIIFILIPGYALAQESGEDIVLGKTITLKSEALGEERQILVYLPDRYEQTSARYPVLYLLDGRNHFLHASSTVQFLSRNGRIPQMIVVAIVNVDRTRDFTPTTVENRPNSGGFDKFISFINDELFPFIEQNYRTLPYRLLEGHSLGGMFSIHVLFKYPQMFQTHFAMSPHIMWDENYVLDRTIEKMKQQPELNNFLFITLGDEPNYVEPLNKLTGTLESKNPEGLEWHFKVMENDNHGTVPLKSLYFGLETLYKDWAVPGAVADMGLAAVQTHYRQLSEKFGYDVVIPENVLNVMGYRLMGRGKVDMAIQFFRHNVELYPESANVYDSLGEGYEAAGQLELAKQNYQKAVNLGAKSNDANLAIYEQHLKNVSEKLNES